MGRRIRRASGFTILELMIAVTIISILAAIAIPSFDEMIKNNRRTTLVNELVSTYMLARAEAAKRGQPVTVCALTSTGGTSCNGGRTWDYGWMAFVDVNANGAIDSSVTLDGVTYNETTMILRNFVSDYATDVKVRTSTGTGHVTFFPFNQGVTPNYALVCDKRGNAKSRRVCVERTGRPRSSETACETADTQTCPSF